MAAILSVACLSCHEDTALNELSFVGDSLVARWDLEASFPTSIVENYGVSGSGLPYLESLAGKFTDKTVVVISGTNDIYQLAYYNNPSPEDYADSYLKAIANLGAKRVYLYCIFPRGKNFDGEKFNPLIQQLNNIVKEKVQQSYPSINYLEVYDLLEYKDFLNPQYTVDGLHLNEYGYAVIADVLNSQN